MEMAAITCQAGCCREQTQPFSWNEQLRMARPEGFEPPTLCLEGRRSIQLSYGRTVQSILPSIIYSYFFEDFICLSSIICHPFTAT
jgi:hypothetical protein